MARSIDVQPAEFATVRAVLGLSQGAFAARLGISRRTVIRGDQRGIELPHRYGWIEHDSQRAPTLRDKWEAARLEAERDTARYLLIARSDTIAKILPGMSQYARDQWEETLARIGRSDTQTRAKVSRVTKPAGGRPRKVSPKKAKRKLARRSK